MKRQTDRHRQKWGSKGVGGGGRERVGEADVNRQTDRHTDRENAISNAKRKLASTTFSSEANFIRRNKIPESKLILGPN